MWVVKRDHDRGDLSGVGVKCGDLILRGWFLRVQLQEPGVCNLLEMRITAAKQALLSIRFPIDHHGLERLEIRIVPRHGRARKHRLAHSPKANHNELHHLLRVGPDGGVIEGLLLQQQPGAVVEKVKNRSVGWSVGSESPLMAKMNAQLWIGDVYECPRRLASGFLCQFQRPDRRLAIFAKSSPVAAKRYFARPRPVFCSKCRSAGLPVSTLAPASSALMPKPAVIRGLDHYSRVVVAPELVDEFRARAAQSKRWCVPGRIPSF